MDSNRSKIQETQNDFSNQRCSGGPVAELAGHARRGRIKTERGRRIQFPSRILSLYPHSRAVGNAINKILDLANYIKGFAK
jgi:hypothetical protein